MFWLHIIGVGSWTNEHFNNTYESAGDNNSKEGIHVHVTVHVNIYVFLLIHVLHVTFYVVFGQDSPSEFCIGGNCLKYANYTVSPCHTFFLFKWVICKHIRKDIFCILFSFKISMDYIVHGGQKMESTQKIYGSKG